MPTYQYACTDCGHDFEAVQSFSDDALTTCPECGGTLRKLFGNVGVVFKGSGFYRTDSRKSDSSSGGSSTAGSGDSSAKKADASATKKEGSTASTATSTSTSSSTSAS